MAAAPSALTNLGVVITRPQHQAEHLARMVEARGGNALRFPTIEIVPLEEQLLPPNLTTTLTALDIAIFVSGNAVAHGWPLIQSHGGLSARTLVAAVGNGTARSLRELGVGRVLHPTTTADTESLLKLPELQDVSTKCIAIFSGVGGRGLLREVLTRRGAQVEVIECYRRVRPKVDVGVLKREIDSGGVAAITATSNEGLANFYAMLDASSAGVARKLPHFVPHARIAEAALAHGVVRAIVTEAGDEALVGAMESYFAKHAAGTAPGVTS